MALPRPLRHLIPLTALLTATHGAASAADDAVRLKVSQTLTLAPPTVVSAASEQFPVFLEADRIDGQQGDHAKAVGNVTIRRLGDLVRADTLLYNQRLDELDGSGHVVFQHGEDRLECEHIQLKLSAHLGELTQTRYFLGRVRGQSGRGESSLLRLKGPDRYQLDDATFTTCPAGNNDWVLRTKDLGLDYISSVGQARDVRVEYLGVPILYAPWLDFSLDDHRKSGFLTPAFGVSDNRGLELLVPWYWNIAANRDATFTPRLMTRRGLQLIGEFRYLEPDYKGELTVEALPNDNASGDGRYRGLFQHSQRFSPRMNGSLLLDSVSDDTYFTDLSNLVNQTSRVLLPREAVLAYQGDWWNTLLKLQGFQTLQDPANPIAHPYHRLPQLQVNADRNDVLGGRMHFNLASEFVRFEHDSDSKAAGNRFYAYPSVDMTFERNYGYVRPKIGWHFTRYDLDRNPDEPSTLSSNRSMPIFTLDSGLSLERDWRWNGRTYLQTLEPRLYYVNIPNREQDALPVFDSSVADLFQAQLFAENQFIGVDRINDANQITLGVTSRFLEPETGLERLQVSLGQRYYFNEQQVTMPGYTARGSNVTDLLAQVSGQITDRWRVASGFQYNPDDGELVRANLGASYRAGPGRLLNADLRYTNENYGAALNQLDLSWQWPVKTGWYSLGRVNYSFEDHRLVEGLLGFEYNAGCWSLRAVMQQLATTTDSSTQAFFMQLELHGLTQLGPNPLEALKRNISGYTKSDELQLP